ncbi:unnamed protein product [Schistocephalus solidus]|uniref:C2H2-type domain-containing protein n=1 Tax=Schistocephalus solidus TaxID=70667 RepID=A0A183SYG1_SCHSO|nr:unnamed protein product [Schistocephalus solidus]
MHKQRGTLLSVSEAVSTSITTNTILRMTITTTTTTLNTRGNALNALPFTTHHQPHRNRFCTSNANSIPTFLHCDCTFLSRIGLVDHLRIHDPDIDTPVPRVSTHTNHIRINNTHYSWIFGQHTDPLGHMRLHEKPSYNTAVKTASAYLAASPPPASTHTLPDQKPTNAISPTPWCGK